MPASRLSTPAYWSARAEEQMVIRDRCYHPGAQRAMAYVIETSKLMERLTAGMPIDSPPSPPPTDKFERFLNDYYITGLMWIIRNKGGVNGGWPPRDTKRVHSWVTVRMLAKLSGKDEMSVAKDLIEWHLALGDP